MDKNDTPRLAATMIVVRDDPFEVLLLERHARAHFPSASVFPGGVVDAEDRDESWLPFLDGASALTVEQRALRIAACRETFEEAGLVVAASGDVPSAPCGLPRDGFRDLVVARDLRLDLAAIQPFAHWITPQGAPKRFDTHFLLVAAPPGIDGLCDGIETVRAEWVAPAEALRWGMAGDREMMLPTLANLHRLAESDDVAAALAVARARPPVTVSPDTVVRDGRRVFSMPEDAGYGDLAAVLAALNRR